MKNSDSDVTLSNIGEKVVARRWKQTGEKRSKQEKMEANKRKAGK